MRFEEETVPHYVVHIAGPVKAKPEDAPYLPIRERERLAKRK